MWKPTARKFLAASSQRLAIAFKPATTTAPLNMVNLKTKHPASTD
jgi:hypothetical protein